MTAKYLPEILVGDMIDDRYQVIENKSLSSRRGRLTMVDTVTGEKMSRIFTADTPFGVTA